jgi:hypothetical protein
VGDTCHQEAKVVSGSGGPTQRHPYQTPLPLIKDRMERGVWSWTLEADLGALIQVVQTCMAPYWTPPLKA